MESTNIKQIVNSCGQTIQVGETYQQLTHVPKADSECYGPTFQAPEFAGEYKVISIGRSPTGTLFAKIFEKDGAEGWLNIDLLVSKNPLPIASVLRDMAEYRKKLPT